MKEDLFIAKTYCQMKTRNAMITSIILSFLTIWITASIIEAGDVNAISMYFAVFLGPIVLVLLLNAIVLAMAKRCKIAGNKAVAYGRATICTHRFSISLRYNYARSRWESFVLGMVAVGITNVV